ncbi:MFS transporter [Ruegeria sp. 2205SS24-7]|uniref:MFS transporter n=1 Tax=Ruegeria discodermiae TaxID=3064389 RepID=UPI0027407E5A|nr:MFS transporter [Ruegeria sp. 2205SS24-7]MDP5218829.1 MFS transporter [Ruegeria sp. 2205SS24-7]
MKPSRRPVVALLFAQAFALSGTRLSMIAIPWLVLNMTGNPMLTGLTAFAEMLPYVISKGLGGPLIDRLGARFVAVVGEATSVVAITLIPLIHFADVLHIHTLIPVVIGVGLLRGPTDAAKQALVPFVADTATLPLERVTGLIGTVDRLATTLGAGLAGALVAFVGAAPALIINAIAFCLAGLFVAFGIPRRSRHLADAGKSYLSDLREGWNFLTEDPVLVRIVVMIAVTNLLDQALISVMLPVWAREYGGGPGAIGLLVAVQSAFAVAGAATAARFGDRMPRLKTYTIAFLIGGAPRFLILLPVVPYDLMFVVLAGAGFAIGFINPIISAVGFERMPEPLVGRVSSLMAALAWALIPFGGLFGGAAIALLGLPATVVVTAAAYFAVTMAPILAPSFRKL